MGASLGLCAQYKLVLYVIHSPQAEVIELNRKQEAAQRWLRVVDLNQEAGDIKISTNHKYKTIDCKLVLNKEVYKKLKHAGHARLTKREGGNKE